MYTMTTEDLRVLQNPCHAVSDFTTCKDGTFISPLQKEGDGAQRIWKPLVTAKRLKMMDWDLGFPPGLRFSPYH